MKIVADINIPYIRGVFEPYGEVVYKRGREISRSDISDADALLVRTRTRCDARLLEGSSVRFIGTATIGTDHIDTLWCMANGIEVASAAGSNAGGVLQWIAAVLALDSSRNGWQPADKTLGVVGVGNVGSLVAEYARSWGFRVVCSDPPRENAEGLGAEEGFMPFQELISVSDIITFHVPLIRSGGNPTYNMAADSFFGALKPGALVVNSSRGGIVSESDLVTSLRSGSCSCVIDTWENEPDIDLELLGMASVATPHIAGYSAQGKANASSMVVNTLARFFSIPLPEWYPDEVAKVGRRKISWSGMCATVGNYCDIASETRVLKHDPQLFEQLREDYIFRQEYF